ncbi:hypothetical protein V5799_028641 [Amblyomma americanum]|uniref:G-protein coupled receptors family 1 profile domain-containing protein n=2 Tax=Amblyomma americanum TaxID=6943 RepID=A0AAQ4DCA2_AMBAM
MFVTITHSKVGLRSTQQLHDRAIAKRFAFIVGTDFLCWMPIVFIKIVAIAGTKIDETLYAWVAVFLLPVNSALNPVLYTLTTRMFKQQLNRFLGNLRQCERPASDRQSGQSWSSLPTVKGAKKTLVTSLSDCTFGKKRNMSMVSYSARDGSLLPLRGSQSCIEKPAFNQMEVTSHRNTLNCGDGVSSANANVTAPKGAQRVPKSKCKRRPRTRLQHDDCV